mmetsp:Transcript_20430/g.38725  ORF Transcript_20430/g.38725 Transcript_20430/m.38725 type:complete len:241 (-) Transcript_20430:79-801(-)|eukprot:scaffold35294_cov183-Amphora_coffeaeformis.AAC.1
MSAEATAAAIQMLENLCLANNRAAADIARGENLEAFRGIRSAAGHVSALTPLIAACEAKRGLGDHPITPGVAVNPIYAVNIWARADDTEGYVFCCPFLVKHISNDDLAKVDLRYMTTLSSVAIFNMALACHLQYRVSDDCQKSEVLANRASTLYSQAAQLLDDTSLRPDESALQVYLAICNNMIEVSLSEGHIHQARQWKAKLDLTLKKASTSTKNTVLVDYFRDIQVIYSGTFVAARAA